MYLCINANLMQVENTVQNDNKQGTYTSIFHNVF